MKKAIIAAWILAATVMFSFLLCVRGTERYRQTSFEVKILSRDLGLMNSQDGTIRPKNMAQFLTMWEGDHSACVHGRWMVVGSNVDTLPHIRKAVMFAPGNKYHETRVVAVLDAWGNPIELKNGKFVSKHMSK